MDLDIPVFDTKGVKRTFYYFFAANAILTVIFVIASQLFNISFQSILAGKDNWILFFILFAGYYYFSAKSRKGLIAIWETDNIAQKFAKYESYYKQKLIWSFITLVIASIVLLFISREYFIYLLILQLAISLMQYPGRKLLTKELQVEGIVFT